MCARSATALVFLFVSQALWASYLPGDSFQWWDAAVPPSATYRSYDTLEAWFDDRIALHYDFDAQGGWAGGPPRVRVTTAGAAEANLVRARVIENGRMVTRTILENGSEVTAGEDSGYRPDMRFDFIIPQRAVVLEYGFRCNEGHDCRDSRGNPGVDPEAVELLAYDDQGFIIGRSTGDDTESASLVPNRVDYKIGLRDETARIAAVALRFTDENAGGPGPRRRMQAVQLVSRIHQEAMPHAAVKETRINTDSSAIDLALPFQLDKATAIIRGFRFFDTSGVLEPVLGVEYEVDTEIIDGVAHITATGDVEFERGNGTVRTDELRLFITVVAWDSRQTELEVSDAFGNLGGIGTQQAAQSGSDPCYRQACGTPNSSGGWPGVAGTRGMDFHYNRDPNESRAWDVWDLAMFPSISRDPGRRRLSTEARMRPDLDHNEGRFALHLTRQVFSGNSVSEPINTLPLQPALPDKFTLPRSITNQAFSYSTQEMEDLGLFCDMDAPVAAVGLRQLAVHTVANGGQIHGNGAFVRELDVELQGAMRDGRVRVRVAGGIDIGESFASDPLDGDHGQIFAVPLCLGLKPSYPAANPITRSLEFVSFKGNPTNATQVGELRNFGDIPLKLFSADFTGDPSIFDINLHFGGASLGRPEALRSYGAITLNPGASVTLDGQFLPQTAGLLSEAVRFQTNVAGNAVVTVPVVGRVSEVVSILPQTINFGIRTVGDNALRNVLIMANDIYSFRLFGFRIEDDVNGAFSVQQASVNVPKGGSHVAPITYAPRVEGEDRARLIVVTDAGDFEITLLGVGTPPPVPQLSPDRSAITFGLVPDGMVADQVIRLESYGMTQVAISNLTVAGSPLVELVGVPRTPIYLDHGETLDLTVRFTAFGYDPSQLMRYADVIIDSDAQQGQIVVPVSGAVAPQ